MEVAMEHVASRSTVSMKVAAALTALILGLGGAASAEVGFLTGPKDGDPTRIALDYVRAHHAELGLVAADLDELEVDSYVSGHSGTTHVTVWQLRGGVRVRTGLMQVNVARDGSIINLHHQFVGNLDAAAEGGDWVELSAIDAVVAAAADLGLQLTEALAVVEPERGPARGTVLSGGGIAIEGIPARLVYEPSLKGGMTLAWALEIAEVGQRHHWLVQVDARTGAVLSREDLVVHEDFHAQAVAAGHGVELAPASAPSKAGDATSTNSYLVYEWPRESPRHNPQGTPGPPNEGRTTQTAPWTSASPFGWHDTNGVAGAEFTITRGNNAHAYDDGNNPGFSPDCGASLDCSFPIDLSQNPNTYEPASLSNLFYWSNVIHDVWHGYGFDEVAGNFQENNYGNGGVGSDSVNAEGQDGSGTCNANFSTPTDGGNPTMQMYVCSLQDGSLDNGVIAHEYGHGISNRLTGGPGTTSCLFNSEQMGEGWSDWIGLVMTMEPGDAATDARGIGTFLFDQPPTGPGIRPAPYSTDFGINNYTYANIGSLAVPHGVGFVWATMLWDMTWELIENGSQSGFDPDIYNGTGGNNLAMQLVIDGMKLQACNPGFVDGRNAILLADQALTGGANQCAIWEAFARRGLGFSASQGSSSSTTDGTAAFDIPPSCEFLFPTPDTVQVCVGQDAQFSVDVNVGFTPPVTLSATGQPAGSSVSFSPNPVAGPLPAAATMTVSSIGVGAVGTHPISVTGTDSAGVPNVESTGVVLEVYPNTLAAPSLVSPADGATGVLPTPTLTWAAVAGAATYLVEVDDDPAFGSVDYSATETDTSHDVTQFLGPQTTYFWRVSADNLCTGGPLSSVRSFETANIGCDTYASTDVPVVISSSGTPTVYSDLPIFESGAIVDINVLNLDVTHTWVGDLDLALTSPEGTTVWFMDRTCSSADNIDINFDDEAAPGPWPCPPIGGGTYQPSNPLADFDGEETLGNWTLTVRDNANADGGSLNSWSLQICRTVPVVETPFFADGFESGDTGGWSATVPAP